MLVVTASAQNLQTYRDIYKANFDRGASSMEMTVSSDFSDYENAFIITVIMHKSTSIDAYAFLNYWHKNATYEDKTSIKALGVKYVKMIMYDINHKKTTHKKLL